MNETPVQPRRKYDNTFKRQAVENWISSGKFAEVIGHELGITANRLYAWQSLGPLPTCNPGWMPPSVNWPESESSATF